MDVIIPPKQAERILKRHGLLESKKTIPKRSISIIKQEYMDSRRRFNTEAKAALYNLAALETLFISN